ncbi:site-specific integrase [Hydrogenophaga sp.]|uniref:tyrosine-type recombinase/integrase n=1 Tax=Hydrogenophaga sp. TaxID=1904254 RepID=UPI00260C4E55|nr:site-specific integrase [Hydrogenophaga sp.]MCW5654025.1 site-specific integrase [Hydrogenophaga sp.]
MGKENLLTDVKIKNAKPGAKLRDGGGLHLVVRPSGEKLWQYRFKLSGKENTHSIGVYDKDSLPLKEARALRDAARKLVKAGKNPNAERQRMREANILAEKLKKESSFHVAFERWMEVTEKGISAPTASQRRREMQQHAKVAMTLLILTAGRRGEVTGACWSEFDFDEAKWEVPKERMKERLPHCVPLSRQAIALLTSWKAMAAGTSPFVFPNRRSAQRPMARGSLNALMGRLGFQSKGTPHGHRSTFSTHFNQLQANPDVIERCLAHVHGNKSRATYNRHEYLDERRQMLQDWADHLDRLRLSGTTQTNETSL